MPLDAPPLANAVQRLREGLARHFRDIPTRTTHTYDADTAAEVIGEIPAFIEEVGYLCSELKRRLP